MQLLKLATSNLVIQLGFGEQLTKKQLLGPKSAGVQAGKHPTNLRPKFISATTEASNFKFGT